MKNGVKALFIIIVVAFVGYIAYFYLSGNYSSINEDGSKASKPITEIVDKTLKSSHVKLEKTDEGLTSITITVIALTNIDYIDISIEFLDRDDNVRKAETKRIENLSTGLSQSVKFSFGFWEALNFEYYSYTYQGKIK